MGTQDTKMVMDTAAWFGNVSTSVLIIFINKVLMSRTGYGFRYGQSCEHDVLQTVHVYGPVPTNSPAYFKCCTPSPGANVLLSCYLSSANLTLVAQPQPCVLSTILSVHSAFG